MNKYDNRYLMLQEEKLSQIIDKQKKVVDVAQEFNVSRQTIHKWLNRYRRFGVDGLRKQERKHSGVPHNRTSEVIEQLVVNSAREYYCDGAETLSDRLKFEYNITLHSTTVWRILKRKEVRYGEQQTWTKKRWKKTTLFPSSTGKRTADGHEISLGLQGGKSNLYHN